MTLPLIHGNSINNQYAYLAKWVRSTDKEMQNALKMVECFIKENNFKAIQALLKSVSSEEIGGFLYTATDSNLDKLQSIKCLKVFFDHFLFCNEINMLFKKVDVFLTNFDLKVMPAYDLQNNVINNWHRKKRESLLNESWNEFYNETTEKIKNQILPFISVKDITYIIAGYYFPKEWRAYLSAPTN